MKLPDLSEVFWAWMAGFMDGDGCIMNIQRGAQWYTEITFLQKEPTPLRRIRDQLGTGSLFLSGRGYWCLRFGSGVSRALCAKLLPHLTAPEKIARAEKALTWKRKVYDARLRHKPIPESARRMFADGSTLRDICNKHGVGYSTVHRWRRAIAPPQDSSS